MSSCEGCVFLGEYSDMGFCAKCCDHSYHYTRSLNDAIEMCKKEDPCEHKVTFDEVYEYEKRRGATADLVEVVRCTDCKHLTVIDDVVLCSRLEYHSEEVDLFHFCSYGERR